MRRALSDRLVWFGLVVCRFDIRPEASVMDENSHTIHEQMNTNSFTR